MAILAEKTGLYGAYYSHGEWVYTTVEKWDELFKRAEGAASRSVRHYLEGGHVDKFIRLGSEWVAI